MAERWRQMPESVRKMAYDIKRDELDSFFQSTFYNQPPPFAFFACDMSYSQEEWYVRCKAVLCDRLSMSTDMAAELVCRAFGTAVKIAYINDWKQLEFAVPYIKVVRV